MRFMSVLPVLAGLALLTACATPTLEGRAALARGSYEEAARHFQEGLAREPGRVADLVGLGVARYKLNALDDAQGAFERALAKSPDLPPARLYLALIAVLRGDNAAADDHLARFLALAPPPRLAAQIDRARGALSTATTPPVRTFVAASLEDGYQWAGEVTAALQAARDAEFRRLADDRLYLLPLACRCR